jgi:CTP synthase
MQKEGLDKIVLKKLGLTHNKEVKLEKWEKFLNRLQNPKQETTIGLVGKYVELQDAYKSISEAIIHAGAKNSCQVKVKWIHAEKINNNNVAKKLAGLKGVIVAPGFGDRGVEGKISAIKYIRENNIPFLGICLGMQSAVIEYSRNVLGLKNANSTEMDAKTPTPVIDLMHEQKEVTEKGGTMRLGAYDCYLQNGSNTYNAYKNNNISERHRHRFEFNNKYKNDLESAGLVATGINKKNNLVEVIEIPSHPWFVGVQFHPEFKSTVDNPHPLFCGFIEACIKKK